MSDTGVLRADAILGPMPFDKASMFPGSPPHYHPAILITSVNATLTSRNFKYLLGVYLIHFKAADPTESDEDLSYTISDTTDGNQQLTIAQSVACYCARDTVVYFALNFADNAPAGIRIAAEITCPYQQISS